MVLPGGLAVLALLPAVAVATVPHLLPRVQQHAPALRPVEMEERMRVAFMVGLMLFVIFLRNLMGF